MGDGGSGSLLEALPGQDAVRTYLTNAFASGRVGQSYLFYGGAGPDRVAGAYALAQGVVCPSGGETGACGACDDCERVARRAHPDVSLLEPESAQGYLMAQVRALIEDSQMAPIRAKKKVYIVDNADKMGASAANALLKSIEEPPESTVFVLLAPSVGAILPTIVSRCQTVRFGAVPPKRSLELVSEKLGLPENVCRRAVGCCPSTVQAMELLASPKRTEARRAMLECFDRLPSSDGADVISLAKSAVEAARAPLEELKEDQATVTAESAKVLSDAAMRELEGRQKRELSAAERSGIMEQLGAARSLLRDALLIAVGSDEPISCDDFERAVRLYASVLSTDRLPGALQAVDETAERIQRNVTPQLAYEAMLLTIKGMITCRP